MYTNFNSPNLFICILAFSKIFNGNLAIKRGPHHPRSEPSTTHKVDQHLTHEEHPIDDDLKNININLDLEDMNDDERTFYFFKAHDSDNNNALDGLELLHAGMHAYHHHVPLTNDESFKKTVRKNYLTETSKEMAHIIEVIDKFLQIADSNNDGMLHYYEYVKAVTGVASE